MNYTEDYKFYHIDLVKYCGASGDFNPIHTVTHVAQEQGYSDVIVPGLMTMGIVSRLIEKKYNLRNLSNLSIRFLHPIYPEEELVIYFHKASNIQGGIEYVVENAEKVKKATGSFVIKKYEEDF